MLHYLLFDGSRFLMIEVVAHVSDQVATPVASVGEMMVRAATQSHADLARRGWGHQVELRRRKAWYLTNKDILTASRTQ